MVTEGKAELSCEGYAEKLTSGQTIFIPATLGEYSLSGKATVLLTTNQPKYYVGIDLGGTNIVAAVVDEYGVIYGRAKKKTNASRSYNEIFDDMAECAKNAAKESGLNFETDIEAVGVGCPGAINTEDGIVEFSNNLGFHDVPIVEYMQKALLKKIYVENHRRPRARREAMAS